MTEEQKDREGAPVAEAPGEAPSTIDKVRRFLEGRPGFVSIGALFLATVVFFWPVVSGSGSFWDDYANYQFPNLLFHAQRVAAMASPAYCSFLDCGRPMGMDAGHCIFYPLYLAIAPWSGDIGVFQRLVSLVYVAHIFLAAAGMYLLCRTWGASRPAGVVGGMTYAFSSFMVLRMGSGNPSVGLSWLPLVVLGLDRLREGSEALTWRSLRVALLTGGALGAVFLAGLLQVQIWVGLLVGAFGVSALIGLAARKGMRPCLNFCLYGAVTAVVGFALSSVFILPVLEYGADSSRLASNIYKDTSFQVPWRMALTNVAPHLFGRVAGPGGGEGWNIFWGGAGFWDYWERVSYAGLAGALGLLAAPFCLRRRPSVEGWLFFGIGVFALLYMYGIGSPLQYALAGLLPPLQGLRNPVRASFLLSFAEAILVARVFDWAWPRGFATAGATVRRLLPAFGVVLAIVVVGAVNAQHLVPTAGGMAAQDLFLGAVYGQILILVGLGAILVGVATGRLTETKGGWLLVAVVFLDMYRFGHGFNTAAQSPVEMNAHNQVSQGIKAAMDKLPPEGRCRFEWDPVSQANLKSVIWEMDNFGGYCMHQPLYLQRLYVLRDTHPETFRDLMNVRFRVHQNRDRVVVETRTNALPRAWFVPTAVSAPKEGAGEMILNPGFNPRKTVMLEDSGPFHVAPPGGGAGAAQLTAFDHTELEAVSEAPVPGYVVFSELYFPGWEADVDGQATDVLRANLIQRAVEVPAGRHTIQMRYRPTGFCAGLWLFGLSAALLAGVGLFEARRVVREKRASAEA